MKSTPKTKLILPPQKPVITRGGKPDMQMVDRIAWAIACRLPILRGDAR